MSQTFSQTAFLRSGLCRSSGSSSLMFELHPCALCYLHIHRSEFEMCSAGGCEGLTEGGLKIHTLCIDTAASRSGVVWRFSFLIRLTLTMAETLNIPSCQLFSLFSLSHQYFDVSAQEMWLGACICFFCALQVSASSSWCCWKWVWFWEWRFTSTWSLSN